MLDCDWICLGNLSKRGAEAPFSFRSVMAGLRPGHPRLSCFSALKTWMPGTSPGMTKPAPSLRQPCLSQAFRGNRKILRLDQQPVIERADAQRGIEPAHVVHGL